MQHHKKDVKISELLDFYCTYAKAYLGSGGPTSRLEESLESLSTVYGLRSEIFAMPTGVIVSVRPENNGDVQTTIARIRDNSSIHLERLCWLENILEDLKKHKISVSQATRILWGKSILRPPYTPLQTILAAFLVGISLSYPRYENLLAAIICGLITVATWWVCGPALKGRVKSAIFRDFAGCLLVLTLGGLCRYFIPGSIAYEAFTIGGIIYLVPGLSLTTAISELADQNLVSGTAKLMNAVLTLLVLGLAYVLVYELSFSSHLPVQSGMVKMTNSFILAISGFTISLAAFCILFRIPKKSLPLATLVGLMGWFILKLLSAKGFVISASFFASFGVGFFSLVLSHLYHVPSQVFSVPGIIAMLPGMMALTSVGSMIFGDPTTGDKLFSQVVLIAGSIVLGLFTARLPFAFILKSKRFPKEGFGIG